MTAGALLPLLLYDSIGAVSMDGAVDSTMEEVVK